jgi:hypothetical protein
MMSPLAVEASSATPIIPSPEAQATVCISARPSRSWTLKSTPVVTFADATVSLKSSLALIEIVGQQDQFIMGDRLKGNNEKKSFRILNKLGNYFFSILWLPILNFKLIDLFCGTKIFPKLLIQEFDHKLKSIDNYGDLTLIFAAKSTGMNIVSKPVEYLARAYGTTNMMRWATARRFLKITFLAYKLKLQSKS